MVFAMRVAFNEHNLSIIGAIVEHNRKIFGAVQHNIIGYFLSTIGSALAVWSILDLCQLRCVYTPPLDYHSTSATVGSTQTLACLGNVLMTIAFGSPRQSLHICYCRLNTHMLGECPNYDMIMTF